jgi:hypothetical protein
MDEECGFGFSVGYLNLERKHLAGVEEAELAEQSGKRMVGITCQD